MSDEFKIEIVNPEKSFLLKEDVTEVVVPAYEGEIGILKDHISIISFLKPGVIKVISKSVEEKFYVDDGIIEFKDNNLSILTSSIINLKDLDKNKIDEMISYELRNNLLGIIWKGKFRGQKQKWFLMRYLGKDEDINIKTKNPEFLDWKWIELDEITNVVVDFKLHVYQLLKEKIKKIIN